MSVYSGFAKRNQEEFYDILTFKLVSMLCDKIVQLNLFEGEWRAACAVLTS